MQGHPTNMTDLAPRKPQLNPFKSLPRWIWILMAIAAVIAILVLIFFARGLIAVFNSYWSFGGIKRVLYQDLGVSDALSSVLATAMAFFEGLVWLPLIAWPFRVLRRKFTWAQTALAFVCWIAAYGTVPILHAAFGRDVCFNQETGTAEKWYVIRDGKVLLFDSPGFDSFGVKKTTVTPDICRIHAQQERGIGAKAITDLPSSIQFFDNSTGLARVWYDRAPDGTIHLFDAPGYDPSSGTVLAPVTKDVVDEILAAARNNSAAPVAPPPLPPAPVAAPVAQPAAANVNEAQSAALSRVSDLFAAWSAPDNSGVESLRQYYGNPVIFYGAVTDVDTIMKQKVQFALRWPTRAYTVRQSSVTVNCSDEHSCMVQGVLDWTASNPATGAHSAGVAQFTYGFRDNLIDEESGKVLSRG